MSESDPRVGTDDIQRPTIDDAGEVPFAVEVRSDQPPQLLGLLRVQHVPAVDFRQGVDGLTQHRADAVAAAPQSLGQSLSPTPSESMKISQDCPLIACRARRARSRNARSTGSRRAPCRPVRATCERRRSAPAG